MTDQTPESSESSPGAIDPSADPTPPRRPRPTGPVQYRGDDLEPARGPGLGCFRIQLVVLVVFVVLTPLTVVWNWPISVSAALLFAVIGLLLVTGQTIIFLLRLVAADRRGRRRPLASGSKTRASSRTSRGSVPSPARRAPCASPPAAMRCRPTRRCRRPDGEEVPPPEGPMRQ